jgi:threonine/homoserine/homoserine lactone efflux protein
MSTATLLAWTTFAWVMSLTPGPNNMMVMHSGLRFGFARTQRHMLGVCLGFTLMFLLVAFGFDQIFRAVPWLLQVMQWISLAFLLWIAYQIASAPIEDFSKPVSNAEANDGQRSAPMGFFAAAGFQWINPKAWLLCIGSIGQYLPQKLMQAPSAISSLLTMSLILLSAGYISTAIWTLFGQALRTWLSAPRRQRFFNWFMALALLASVLPGLFD